MKKALIAIVMGVAAAGAASAQTGFYLGVEGGLTFFEDTTDEEADQYINDGANSVEVEQKLAALPIRPFAGFEITENISVELGLTFYSRDMSAKGTVGLATFKDTIEMSWRIIDYSVLLRPSASGFFARVGGHSTTVDFDFDRKGTGAIASGSDSVSESKTGLLLGLGYDWEMGPGALRASFTHYTNMPGYEDKYLNLFKVGYLFKF